LRADIDDVAIRLSRLQEAEDNYYATAKHILVISQKAYNLFVGSEVEEKRQLIKLVLSNLRVDGKNIGYDAQKPFNLILEHADSQVWRPLVDTLLNHALEFTVSLSHIQTVFSCLGIVL